MSSSGGRAAANDAGTALPSLNMINNNNNNTNTQTQAAITNPPPPLPAPAPAPSSTSSSSSSASAAPPSLPPRPSGALYAPPPSAMMYPPHHHPFHAPYPYAHPYPYMPPPPLSASGVPPPPPLTSGASFHPPPQQRPPQLTTSTSATQHQQHQQQQPPHQQMIRSPYPPYPPYPPALYQHQPYSSHPYPPSLPIGPSASASQPMKRPAKLDEHNNNNKEAAAPPSKFTLITTYTPATPMSATRDRSLFLLLVLCALTLLCISFHAHRLSADHRSMPTAISNIAYGFCIAGLILKFLPVLIIFCSDVYTVYHRFIMLLELHSFLALLVSYILYIPLLFYYVPTHSYLLPALVLHLILICLDYLFLVRCVVGALCSLSATFLSGSDDALEKNKVESLQLQNAQQNVVGLRDQKRQLREQVEELKNEALERDKAHVNKLNDYMCELELLQKKNAALEQMADDRRRDDATHNNSAALNNLQDIERIRAECEARIATWRSQCQLHEQTIANLNETLDRYRDEIDQLSKQYADMKFKYDNLKMKNNNDVVNDLEKKIIVLEAKLSYLQKLYDDVMLQKTRLADDVALMKQGQCLSCNQLRKHIVALEEKQEANDELSAKLDKQHHEIANLQHQLNTLRKRDAKLAERTKQTVNQMEQEIQDFDRFAHQIQKQSH